MDIMELGAIGELVGGVAVIGSLIYVGLQVRQGNRLTQAERMQAHIDARNRGLTQLQNPTFAGIFRRGMNDFQQLTKDEQMALHAQLMNIVSLDQAHFILSRSGLIPKDYASAMQIAGPTVLKSPGGTDWWQTMRRIFVPEYVAHVDSMLGDPALRPMTEAVPWVAPDEQSPRRA